LEKVDPKTQVARIAHTVGENKRVLIVEEAKKRSIRLLNPGLKKAPELEVVPPTEPEAASTAPPTEGKDEAAKPEDKATEKPTGTKKRKTRKSSK
jgi:hypothetical protein